MIFIAFAKCEGVAFCFRGLVTIGTAAVGRCGVAGVNRAVSLGSFKQQPVSADAMYNGEIHSYRGVQTIRVIE